ncbi:MAG: HD-GYP domain-containing protein [Desulfobacterales bacterium]
MTELDITGLFVALDIVVMEHIGDGSIQVIGTIPDWFGQLYPNVDMKIGRLRLEEESSFLELFLDDAKNFWMKNETGRLTSEVWTETDSSGNEYALEALAVCFRGKNILLIESIGASFKERHAFFQKAKETLLDKEILEQMIAERTANLRKTMKDLRKALDAIVHVLALTLEVRDPYIAGHQRRVANLARAIAAEMGLLEEVAESIYMGGVIHDLGKISVPAELLSKPSRLSENEFNLIKDHPQVGYNILKDIEFPWDIARMVLQHHEKMDGSGYPQGLSGEDILLEARILTIADVVEAMASHRPYRPALGIDKALEEISINKGKFYDTEAANACLRIFKDKEFEFK